ncbi:hypothetical protein J7K93_02455 [bacterium]|nr:hypothetical protein [bacterium]
MPEELFNTIPANTKAIIEDMHRFGLGELEDIANSTVSLLAKHSKWNTGAVLTVESGYTTS